ncbi:MAG: SHOCT domain-containing protein [Actinomycetales bacterium]|nr:SHOCT domain-containing protein [Actinomycetales bacterium]
MQPDAPQPGFGGRFFDGGMHHVIGFRGGLFLAFLVVLLAVAIVALLLSMRRRREDVGEAHAMTRPSSGANAMRILDERLARGDLDVEEYTRRRDVLLGQPSPNTAS